MKRLALVAAVLAVAACGKKEEAPAADTSAMTPAPAMAPAADSANKMADSANKMADTAMKKADSAKKIADSVKKM